MKEKKYRVGGRGKTLSLQDAISKANRIYERTGVFAAVEEVKRKFLKD